MYRIKLTKMIENNLNKSKLDFIYEKRERRSI